MKSRTKQRRELHVEPLERRECLAASVGWDGPGRGAAALTYYVGNVPSSVGLTPTQVESAIKTALGAWSGAAAVKFTKTTVPNQVDSIDIRFVSIDGPGGALAQAYFPDDVNSGRIAGDIEIDVAERWEVGNSQGSAAFDLALVLTHEMGHSLGLDHSAAAGSVMAATVSPSQSFSRLATTDVKAIQTLYAPAGSSIAPTNTNNNTTTTTPTLPRTPFGGNRHRFGRETAVPDPVLASTPVSSTKKAAASDANLESLVDATHRIFAQIGSAKSVKIGSRFAFV